MSYVKGQEESILETLEVPRKLLSVTNYAIGRRVLNFFTSPKV